MNKEADHLEGVYLAHHSMGVARYGGRGAIFNRLATHKKSTIPKELLYYSFYIIENKAHEREIETALLRAAGPRMIILNNRKVASWIAPLEISATMQPDTEFFEQTKHSRPKGKQKEKENLKLKYRAMRSNSPAISADGRGRVGFGHGNRGRPFALTTSHRALNACLASSESPHSRGRPAHSATCK